MASDYIIAWVGYVVAALALLLVFWRMTAWSKLADLRTIIMVMACAFLFTPVQVEQGSAYWSPAFMAALIDMVTVSAEAAMLRAWPILIVMLSLLVVSLGWRFYSHRAGKPSSCD